MQQLDTATHHAVFSEAEVPRGHQFIRDPKADQQADRLIRDTAELDRITGTKKSLRYELMRRGEFPQSVKITPRCVAWSERQVLQWVQDRINAAALAAKVGQA